ncbi:class I adenylate-forming enzyme family protein [Pimelobacter simplex]|uniref:class I adenylate-forming enzyme family protein n=1 Tax=Nocardioides simplex TaxID=2045 RepID=UPI003AAD2A4E
MQTWIHVLDWRASADADAVAIRDDRGALTYGELHALVETRAGGWHERGVRSGDVVAVLSRNSAEMLVQTLALVRIGALPLLLNWRMTAPEVAELLAMTAPVGVFADPTSTALVDVLPGATRVVDGPATDGWLAAAGLVGDPPARPDERLRVDEVALLMHTSGTTGRPKVIPLDHGSLIRNLSGFAIDIGDQVRGSNHLVMMPLFHLAGFAQAMQCFLTGGTLVVHDGFDADRVIDTIAGQRINFFTAAPTIIEMLVDTLETRRQDADLSSLREIQYGAAPIAPELLERAVRRVCGRFRQIYGSTELQGFLSVLRPEDHVAGTARLASAGQVVLGWEARLVDAAGVAVPHGTPGELHVRSENLIAEYWRDPDETARAFTDDGWFRTGDVGILSAEGYLSIVGRAKDMIISGGENIYPAEIERALLDHPDVAEVAVVARPHEHWGETPFAFVVPEPAVATLDPDELRAFCRARLAGFKCPSGFEVIDALPRNALGKVLKVDLRRQLVDTVPPTR